MYNKSISIHKHTDMHQFREEIMCRYKFNTIYGYERAINANKTKMKISQQIC